MDLLKTAWRPSAFQSGRMLEVAANYGGHGSMIPLNLTPTRQTAPSYDPHNPQWNRLENIQWEQIVLTPAEVSALGQAGLIQVPDQKPATYTSPGTASLSSGG